MFARCQKHAEGGPADAFIPEPAARLTAGVEAQKEDVFQAVVAHFEQPHARMPLLELPLQPHLHTRDENMRPDGEVSYSLPSATR